MPSRECRNLGCDGERITQAETRSVIINIVRGWPPSSRVSRVGAQTVSLGVVVVIADLDREASSTRRGSGEARKGRAPWIVRVGRGGEPMTRRRRE